MLILEMKELLDRIQALQKQFEKIKNNLNLEKKQKELEKLQKKMADANFWNNQNNAKKTSQKAGYLENFIRNWQEIKSSLKDLPELLEMAKKEDFEVFKEDIAELEKKFKQGETELLLSGEHDSKNAILSIHVGNGGQDAEDFCQMLLRMYLRFCEEKKWTSKILEESSSDVGLKSVTIEINGTTAYGLLKSEHGVHRLIRLSPFNAKNLRQTSFARVEVLPEIDNDTEIEIDEKDLRIDVFRSSGCGGQSVNTTDSAVRVTYLPLNIVVTCQNEKSQLQNKQSAIKVLKSRLLQLKLEQKTKEISELRGEIMENSFGSQIRTYTLQPYKLVKDHRTDAEHTNPDKVFDGDLNLFIETFLRKKKGT